MSSALPSSALDAIARGWTVVTANQRSARSLRRAYDLARRDSGASGWQPPPVFAWDTWLATLWRAMILDGNTDRMLLNATQEHALWCEVIASDLAAQPRSAALPGPRSTDSLAELAADAWRLLHTYRCRRALPARADTSDTRAFLRWAAAFERLCARDGYISAAQLPETLSEAGARGRIALAPPGDHGILLVGFDALAPARTALLGALTEAGIPVETLAQPRPDPHASRTLVRAQDPLHERTVCARWLRSHLEQHPQARIAVVLPAPAAVRASVERSFRRILAPELEDIAAALPSPSPFEFSLGVPLASTPAAAAALQILSWTAEPLPLEHVSALLLSPHFAGTAEYLARAEFDAFTLRRQSLLDPALSIQELEDCLKASHATAALPALGRHLRALRTEAERTARLAPQGYAAWSESFARLLDAAGWTHAAGQHSAEFQARRRWQSALDELASLDFTGRRVEFRVALAALRRIAENTLFAPESHDAPVQVMGPMEAAGSQYDAVWFLGAGDLDWPLRPQSNPLLPWGLQRELGMPGADPERDTDLARSITRRIAASAPTVIFSYAAQTAEGHQRPSPVLPGGDPGGDPGSDFTPADPAELVPPEMSSPPLPVQRIADESILPPPPEHLRGGADLLKAQAACGFRAFAEKRLASAALDTRGLGLTALERGSLVHRTLEIFWRQVETQTALRLLTPAERTGTLAAAIDEALDKHTRGNLAEWPKAYLATERTRLLRLLGRWLELELQRPPFAVRALEEALRNVQIGPLRLNVRVDRIDLQIVDGEPAGEILLDYKTGSVRPAHWLGNRPDEPQLPLYAVLMSAAHPHAGPPPLAGVAFASLRAGDAMELTGYERQKGVLPKSSTVPAGSLDAQVEEWRAVLTELARQFHQADVSVTPKKYPLTCRNCQQRLLCRLDPATLDPVALEDLAEENQRENAIA